MSTAATPRQRGRRPGANAAAVLLLDNYDSFTFNLFHYLGELGAEVDVLRNDAATPDEALAMRPDAVVISPGPCDPDRAGITLDLIEEAAPVCPVLGVCLGHQAIGQAYGGRVVRAGTRPRQNQPRPPRRHRRVP